MFSEEKVGYKDQAEKGFGKNINDSIMFKGKLILELFDKDGKLKDKREVENTVCNDGLETIANRLLESPTIDQPTHMAVGTTSGGKTAASTTLEAEVGSSRTALTSTTQGTSGNRNKVTWVCTFAAGIGTGALKEAGVFNAGSGGKLFCYTEFGTLTKEAADSLTVTWVLTCGTIT